MRPIDGDALLEEVREVEFFYPYGGHAELLAVDVDDIRNAPTLDYAPVVHAHWITSRRHIWERDSSGEINEWAWDYEFHNGVRCTVCGTHRCVHCHPDWETHDDCGEVHYECSECGRVCMTQEPYCHCGAKMDEASDE